MTIVFELSFESLYFQVTWLFARTIYFLLFPPTWQWRGRSKLMDWLTMWRDDYERRGTLSWGKKGRNGERRRRGRKGWRLKEEGRTVEDRWQNGKGGELSWRNWTIEQERWYMYLWSTLDLKNAPHFKILKILIWYVTDFKNFLYIFNVSKD